MGSEKSLKPEKRFIDANALLRFVDFDAKAIIPKQHSANDILYMIKTAPTVDAVEVVHGRWIDTPHAYGFVSPRCSACLQFSKYHEKFNYCPNCGAEMKGE